ncbi:hypothetical protein HDV00_007890 [Rhizophlyctis rosea]|nr:hypothetical protein HDV00_007890 [Rhizophlyctis rosea]
MACYRHSQLISTTRSLLNNPPRKFPTRSFHAPTSSTQQTQYQKPPFQRLPPNSKPTRPTHKLTPAGLLRPRDSPAKTWQHNTNLTVATDSESLPQRRIYGGLSKEPISEEAERILSEPVQIEDLDIDPELGYIYLKEPIYKSRLTRAFGEDNWHLIPTSNFHTSTPDGTTLYRSYALFINGHFISEAIGDQNLNKVPPGKDPKELCEYIALVRTCKDLGVALELWDPRMSNELRGKRWKGELVVEGGFKRWRWIPKAAAVDL